MKQALPLALSVLSLVLTFLLGWPTFSDWLDRPSEELEVTLEYGGYRFPYAIIDELQAPPWKNDKVLQNIVKNYAGLRGFYRMALTNTGETKMSSIRIEVGQNVYQVAVTQPEAHRVYTTTNPNDDPIRIESLEPLEADRSIYVYAWLRTETRHVLKDIRVYVNERRIEIDTKYYYRPVFDRIKQVLPWVFVLANTALILWIMNRAEKKANLPGTPAPPATLPGTPPLVSQVPTTTKRRRSIRRQQPIP